MLYIKCGRVLENMMIVFVRNDIVYKNRIKENMSVDMLSSPMLRKGWCHCGHSRTAAGYMLLFFHVLDSLCKYIHA